MLYWDNGEISTKNEYEIVVPLNLSFLSDFCCLLIILANSLEPDQDRRKVGPDLDSNCLTLWECSWKNFFEKVNFEKR